MTFCPGAVMTLIIGPTTGGAGWLLDVSPGVTAVGEAATGGIL